MSAVEFVWLLAWNIVDGQWSRIELPQEAARKLLVDFIGKIHGDPLQAAADSEIRLQQRLMALRRESFEAIQQEAPFSRRARRNMRAVLRAWMEGGAAGVERVWREMFQPGWEAGRTCREPIRIIGLVGDCEERALTVIGAPDRQTRVAAEWWYLYFTFGQNWTPLMHSTLAPLEGGPRFSLHRIQHHAEGSKDIYFNRAMD